MNPDLSLEKGQTVFIICKTCCVTECQYIQLSGMLYQFERKMKFNPDLELKEVFIQYEKIEKDLFLDREKVAIEIVNRWAKTQDEKTIELLYQMWENNYLEYSSLSIESIKSEVEKQTNIKL